MMFLLFGVVVIAAVVADPATNQLPEYKNSTCDPIGIISSSNGAPVELQDTTVLNSPLIINKYFMESMSHLVRERIPERIVHAKGAGAFGYFQVTDDVTDICNAKFLSGIGKKTPIVVRFSLSNKEKGESDSTIDARGFAVKFYTEEGNFDIAAFHTPMFSIKDPNIFPATVRVSRRNPVSNLKDPNMLWDFISLRPETAFITLYLLSDNGIPDGFRHMPGFSIHTYQFHDEHGESFFGRFHIIPDKGIKNIFVKQAANLSATDPDYAARDLYNAIERGDFPSWTVNLQVLTLEDVKNDNFDVFDITKVLPLDKYPLRPIGKLVLNKNPTNFFADMEQLAFCPSNLVPGILGGPDKLFEARRFAYRDAQLYRLGGNFNNILVNCPFRNLFLYDRDGVPPVKNNGGGSPNYYPNSFHGPVPYVDEKRPKLIDVTHDTSYNFDQVAHWYANEIKEEERIRLIENILNNNLEITDKTVQKRIIKLFYKIHPDLGHRVAAGLAKKTLKKN